MRKKLTKQLTKKLTTIVLAVALLLTTVISGISVSASTIDPDIPGQASFTVKKTDGKQPVEGAVFTLYKIMHLKASETAGDYAEYSVVPEFAEVLKDVKPNDLGNYSAAQIEKLVDHIYAFSKDAPATVIREMDPTDEDGISFYDDLELGYYLVVETTVPTGYVGARPFFVALPSTNNFNNDGAEGTEWVYDLEVEPKNAPLVVSKEISNAHGDHENGTAGNETFGGADTVAINDIVRYQIKTVIPYYTAEYFDDGQIPVFELTDKMSKGLQILDPATTLPYEEVVIKANGTTLVEGDDYNIVFSNDKTNPDIPDMFVSFTEDFLKNTLNHGAFVTVDYAAKVTVDAVRGQAGNPNKVVLKFTNEPGTDGEGNPYVEVTPPEVKYVYTYVIEILKTEEGSEKLLQGAEFELYKADKDGNITTDLVEKTKVTDVNGLIRFDHVDAGLYYIVETKSPAGYTLLTNPIKVRIEAIKNVGTGDPEGQIKFYIDDKEITANEAGDGSKFQSYRNQNTGVVRVSVENKKGFSLPGTGGMGITIFIAIAFIGITSISVILMKKKKA